MKIPVVWCAAAFAGAILVARGLPAALCAGAVAAVVIGAALVWRELSIRRSHSLWSRGSPRVVERYVQAACVCCEPMGMEQSPR
jgi:hypothetical protein